MAQEQLCMKCGTVAYMHEYKKGSTLVAVILWLCGLLPGLIYSLWRQTTVYWGCPRCAAANMIPLNSPVAQKFLAETKPGQPLDVYRVPAPPARRIGAGTIAALVGGLLVLGSIVRVAMVANENSSSATPTTASAVTTPTKWEPATAAIEMCRSRAVEEQKALATWVLRDKYTVRPQTKQDKLDAKNPNLIHVQVVWAPFSVDAQIPLVVADCRVTYRNDKLSMTTFKTFCKPQDCSF